LEIFLYHSLSQLTLFNPHTMSRSFRQQRSSAHCHDINDGAGSDPQLVLQRYREQLYLELEEKIGIANTDARTRNAIFSKHGSLVRYRELMERRAEKKISQRALTLGVVYRIVGGKKQAWSSFGAKYQDRRAQNDEIIQEFLSDSSAKLSVGNDAGKNISEHLLSFADLDLINYNDEADWSKYVHDTWHRNAAFKLHVRVARRGDLVTLTWTKNEIDEGKRESSLNSNSNYPKDQYTWFRGNKRWLLVDFESTLSTDWPHMQMINVIFDTIENECVPDQEDKGRKKKFKIKDTPRLQLTDTGRKFQDQLNKDVTHMVVTRKVHQNEMDNSVNEKNSMSNQRMSFLG